MAQIGHTDARLTLSVYAQVVQRRQADVDLIAQLMAFASEATDVVATEWPLSDRWPKRRPRGRDPGPRKPAGAGLRGKRTTGLEPATSSLGSLRSTN